MAEKTRVNMLGQTEGYDDVTGEVLWVQKSSRTKRQYFRAPKKADSETHHYVLDASGKKHFVPKGTNPDHIPAMVWPYNLTTAMHICQKITEGMTVRDIGLLEGFPTANVIWSWQRKYPDFDREMKAARKARAEHYHDEVIQIARNTTNKSNKQDRLKVEVYKWAAGVNDAETYGNRVTHAGDASSPIQMVIATGVPQPEVEKKEDQPIDAEFTPVGEE